MKTIYGAAARAAIRVVAASTETTAIRVAQRRRSRPCRFTTKTSSSVIRQWRGPRTRR